MPCLCSRADASFAKSRAMPPAYVVIETSGRQANELRRNRRGSMKTRLFPIYLPAVAITCLMSMSASVMATEKKGSESSPPKFSSADETFMMSAAQAGMVEVKLGEVAAQKATKPDVKEFGAMMVSDHSKANNELKAIAAKNGVTLPSKLDAAHQE